ncbi:hypothetical protein [Nitrososphaera viennensis]|uniref:C2H2-type domain-containing protein n=2 Tax=Nitrososphaera viennensis TaxID=1034015 RepID=A0A060HMD4_9ARCH|nr:hypothetical protein [Nitrososphaera viennensis]AIC16643.1 hypothetical protein NVIE_023820 [Nitrososphaera viennensis EN76]UVS68567.1 hypothetical protein NWT39_11740 [Nitrososphaera viennensis]
MPLTISCAGDAEFAARIRDVLAESGMEVSIAEDEVEAQEEDDDDGNNNRQAKDLVKRYVASVGGGHSVIEFGDVLVVGIRSEPEALGLYVCDQCGFQGVSQEGIDEHKKLHGGYLFMPAFL